LLSAFALTFTALAALSVASLTALALCTRFPGYACLTALTTLLTRDAALGPVAGLP